MPKHNQTEEHVIGRKILTKKTPPKPQLPKANLKDAQVEEGIAKSAKKQNGENDDKF